jgi:hypothetical protein
MNKVTLTVIAIIVVLSLAIDAGLAYFYGEKGTISWQFVNLAHEWPIVPFLLGYLCGHLTWQLRNPPKD